MKSINGLLNEFILDHKENKYIYSNEIKNRISESSITNQYIENTVGWDSVSMILLGERFEKVGPIIFTNKSVIICSAVKQVFNTPNFSGIHNEGHILREIGWLKCMFEIDYLHFHELHCKPCTWKYWIFKAPKDNGYLSFDNKLIMFLEKKNNPILPILELLKLKIKDYVDRLPDTHQLKQVQSNIELPNPRKFI